MNFLLTFGVQAERRVISMLRQKGFRSIKWNHPNHFPDGESWWDINADGWLLEVKASSFSKKSGGWQFNLHRHGKLNANALTAYIFCLQKVPETGKSWTYLVIPSTELSVKLTVRISMRTLLSKYALFVDRWDLILKSPKLR